MSTHNKNDASEPYTTIKTGRRDGDIDIKISRLLFDPACLPTQPIYFTDCPLPKMVLVTHP